MPLHEPSTALVLSGLDGGNPLAFLAALGTLRTATRADRSAEWRLSWTIHCGHWSPVLVGGMGANGTAALTEDGVAGTERFGVALDEARAVPRSSLTPGTSYAYGDVRFL